MPVQSHGFHNPNTKTVDRICSLNSEKKIEPGLNLGCSILKGNKTVFCFLKQKEEKRIYSKFHPPRIFFCFSYFILRKLRGEGRREFILNSTPLEFLESSFVFCISLFENQRSRDETVVVSKSKERGGWGGRSPPHFACYWKEGRREKGL